MHKTGNSIPLTDLSQLKSERSSLILHTTNTQIKLREAPGLIASLVMPIGIFIGGYNIGLSSPAKKELIDDGIFTEMTYPFFVSILFLGALVGSLISGIIVSHLSKKFVMVICSVLGYAGWYMVIISQSSGQLIFALINVSLARFLIGVFEGATISLTGLYVAELAHKRRRKLYSSFFGLYLRLGILSVYILGIWVSFRWIAFSALFIICLQVVSIIGLPYSPTWLVSKGYTNKARNTLRFLHGKHFDVEAEIRKILRMKVDSMIRKEKRYSSTLFSRPVIKPIVICSTFMLLKEFSGYEAITAYAAPIYQQTISINPKIAAVFYPALVTMGSLISILLMNKVNRKGLLYVTNIMQGIALLSMAVYVFVDSYWLNCARTTHGYCKLVLLWPIISLSGFGFFYTLGWGTISWVLYVELFEENHKEISAGIVSGVMCLSGFLITTLFPYMVQITNIAVTFLFLSGVCFLGVIYEYWFIP